MKKVFKVTLFHPDLQVGIIIYRVTFMIYHTSEGDSGNLLIDSEVYRINLKKKQLLREAYRGLYDIDTPFVAKC